MSEETGLEKVAGSLPVAGAAAILSAVVGSPIAALLPVLTSTLADGRHKRRVEAALGSIQKELNELGDALINLSDAQFKFINESVISILHSPDDQKIEYLKQGIRQSSAHDRLNLHEASLVSRALRDITVEELSFLIECQGSKIMFHKNPKEGCITVSKLTYDGELATGLISLGLLTKSQGEGTWDDDGSYIFTPIALKLIETVSESNRIAKSV